jgi:hypothetical protein
MPTDGSANPAWFLAVGGGATVRKLKWFTYLDSNDTTIEAVAVLMADGRLLRRNMNPAGSAALLATGVSDFAIHRRTAGFPSVTTVYIYAAKGEVNTIVSPSATAGSLLRINTRTGQATTIYTASGKNQLISVTTDNDSFSSPFFNGTPKNVYITEARVEFGGLFWAMTDFYIYRHSLPGPTSDWDWIVATGGGGNLRSDDQYLYFNTGTRIKRIPTDAPPIELELKADDLEVVQNSQDLDNSVRLVANKATFVRAYAHLTKNTTGKNTWFASATLTGQRDGQNLPGSPLSHVNNASIDTTANLTTLRGSLNTSYLFELPESWTTGGDVLLTSQSIPAVAFRNRRVTERRQCGGHDGSLREERSALPGARADAHHCAGLQSECARFRSGGNPGRTRSLLPVEDFRVLRSTSRSKNRCSMSRSNGYRVRCLRSSARSRCPRSAWTIQHAVR